MAAERGEVGRDVHRRRADGFGQRGNLLIRAPTGHHQTSVERLVELAQRVVEVLQPPRSRRRIQARVEHIAGQHLAVGLRGVQQRRKIAQPQIPDAKPVSRVLLVPPLDGNSGASPAAGATTDPRFAANPNARLEFFYDRSSWFDSHIGLYPVGRLTKLDGLPLAPAR